MLERAGPLAHRGRPGGGHPRRSARRRRHRGLLTCAPLRLWAAALLLLGGLCALSAAAAPKTDIVQLRNGDRVTGEVKGLARGILTFKTDDMSTVSIEWSHVAMLQTLQRLQVKLASGRLYFGTVPQFAAPGNLRLEEGRGPSATAVELPLGDIVAIDPIDQGTRLVTRLDGYLTAGYTYTKSNSQQEFNFTGGLSETLERRRWSIDASATLSTNQGGNDTQRAAINGVYRWSLEKRWFWQTVAGAERNEELGLDLRALAGAGIGRYLVQNSRHEWAAYVAAVGTRESPLDEPSKKSIEALFGTEYAFFQYDTPKRELDVRWQVLPSLTDAGRVRSEAALESRWEIVKDFIFAVSVNGSYDSRPGEHAQSHADFGVVTSLGITF